MVTNIEKLVAIKSLSDFEYICLAIMGLDFVWRQEGAEREHRAIQAAKEAQRKADRAAELEVWLDYEAEKEMQRYGL